MFWSACSGLIGLQPGVGKRSAGSRGRLPPHPAPSAADATGQCNSSPSFPAAYLPSTPHPVSPASFPYSLPARAAGSGRPCKERGLPGTVASRPESPHLSFQTSFVSGTGSKRRWKVGFHTASGGRSRPGPSRAPHLPRCLAPRWGQHWSRPGPRRRASSPLHFGAARACTAVEGRPESVIQRGRVSPLPEAGASQGDWKPRAAHRPPVPSEGCGRG